MIVKTKKQLSENKELGKAIRIIWMISGLLSIIILLITFFASPDFVLKSMPTCEYKLQNKSCIFCGMTRAFFKIREFKFAEAYQLNKLSLFGFSGLIINNILVIINLKNTLKKI